MGFNPPQVKVSRGSIRVSDVFLFWCCTKYLKLTYLMSHGNLLLSDTSNTHPVTQPAWWIIYTPNSKCACSSHCITALYFSSWSRVDLCCVHDLPQGKDDVTGEPLVQHDDDKPEALMARLRHYKDVAKPVMDLYKSVNASVSCDAQHWEQWFSYVLLWMHCFWCQSVKLSLIRQKKCCYRSNVVNFVMFTPSQNWRSDQNLVFSSFASL